MKAGENAGKKHRVLSYNAAGTEKAGCREQSKFVKDTSIGMDHYCISCCAIAILPQLPRTSS